MDLDLSDLAGVEAGRGELVEMPFVGNEADVRGCFYNFAIDELAGWFGFDDPVTLDELRAFDMHPKDVWDSSLRRSRPIREGEKVFPCMRAMCMDRSWALHFSNEAANHRVAGAADQPPT